MVAMEAVETVVEVVVKEAKVVEMEATKEA
mgnify:CR=1 FL=1